MYGYDLAVSTLSYLAAATHMADVTDPAAQRHPEEPLGQSGKREWTATFHGVLPAPWRPDSSVQLVGLLPDALVGFESLGDDIEFALRSLQILRTMTEPPNGPRIMSTALWNAALIAYGRCFTTGRNYQYRERLTIPTDRKPVHKWLLDFRDQHIAHLDQANDSEQVLALAVLEPAPGHGLLDVSATGMKFANPSDLLLSQVIDHLVWLSTEIERHRADASRALLNAVKAVPLAHMYRSAARNTKVRIEDPST